MSMALAISTQGRGQGSALKSPAGEDGALAASLSGQPDGGSLSYPLALVKRQRDELVNEGMGSPRGQGMLAAL